jgi:hypothetical protein
MLIKASGFGSSSVFLILKLLLANKSHLIASGDFIDYEKVN